MDAGSILLILALVFAVGLFISRPFFARARPDASGETGQKSTLSDNAERRRSALLAEKDRLLTAIQELDFDHRLGKIQEEDYPAMRAGLMQNAALVLRRLDEFQDRPQRGAVEDLIEQAVAARRADARVRASVQAPAAVPAAGVIEKDDDVEELIAARRREREEKSSGFCPKCGRPVKKSDRFCSKCGSVV